MVPEHRLNGSPERPQKSFCYPEEEAQTPSQHLSFLPFPFPLGGSGLNSQVAGNSPFQGRALDPSQVFKILPPSFYACFLPPS